MDVPTESGREVAGGAGYASFERGFVFVLVVCLRFRFTLSLVLFAGLADRVGARFLLLGCCTVIDMSSEVGAEVTCRWHAGGTE